MKVYHFSQFRFEYDNRLKVWLLCVDGDWYMIPRKFAKSLIKQYRFQCKVFSEVMPL